MTYDCYCALCAGALYPLSDRKFGKKTRKALAKRKKYVEKEKRRWTGETASDNEDRDMIDQHGVDCQCEGDCACDQQSEAGSMDSFDEQHKYNPELVDESSTAWLGEAQCVGFNPDAQCCTSKAFISGQGSYNDYGEFCVHHGGGDPNEPEDGGELDCFYSFNTNLIPVFPFHEACYRLLARSLFGDDDVEQIDKDALYSAMSQLLNYLPRSLKLDYGDLVSIEQTWECRSGEELLACCPDFDGSARATVETLMTSVNLAEKPSTLNLEHRVRNDPLNRLPHDILYMVFPYLSGKSIFSLMQASWHVFSATQNNGFWKRMIRHDFLPWFWELDGLDESENLKEVDYKQLYLWLDSLTKPTFGMEGPFMRIANRRRIWSVCEEFGEHYLKEQAFSSEGDQNEKEDEAADAILEDSISLQMPLSMYPKPQGARFIYEQWIRSWDEIDDPQPSTFESYWNKNGDLVGLGVRFETDLRLLGQGESKELGVTESTALIPSGQWINAITLHISNVDMFVENQLKIASIKALTLTLTDGATIDVGHRTPELNQRGLDLYQGLHLVGVGATIAVVPHNGCTVLATQNNIDFSRTYSGVITRLGLMQCAHPTQQDEDSEYWPEARLETRLLWHPQASKVPLSDGGNCPIWRHPDIRIIEFEYTNRFDETPMAIMPHQALIWAKGISELKQLKRISAFVVKSKRVLNSESDTRQIEEVLGFRVEFQPDYNEPARTIGCGHLPPVESETESSQTAPRSNATEWADEHMIHFDIDGPGGEVITEIYVAEEATAIKLQTNWNNECYWGEPDRGRFDIRQAGEDEVLVGMAVCFASKSRFSNRLKTYDWMKTHTCTGFVMSTGG